MSDTAPGLYSQQIMPEEVLPVLYFQLSFDHQLIVPDLLFWQSVPR